VRAAIGISGNGLVQIFMAGRGASGVVPGAGDYQNPARCFWEAAQHDKAGKQCQDSNRHRRNHAIHRHTLEVRVEK
jgi:hypothetical protein